MDKEQRLVLQNQEVILRALFRVCKVDRVNDDLRRQWSKTTLALVEWEKRGDKDA